MMKIIGTAIIAISVFLIGLSYYLKYKKRPQVLEMFIELLIAYQTELKWSQKSIVEVIETFDSSRCVEYISKVKCLAKNMSIEQAFVDNNSEFDILLLGDNDRLIIKHFFKECGKLSLKSEIDLCDRTINALTAQKNNASLESEKFGTLSLKLGAICGVWVAIMMI